MRSNILVIDDSHAVGRFLSEHLMKSSPEYQVRTAKSADRAIELARAEKPELVLLDTTLPDRGSEKICQELLVDPSTARIPVLLMGAIINDGHEWSGRFANVSRTLSKPLSHELVCATVRSYLREIHQSRSAHAARDSKKEAPGPLPDSKVLIIKGNTAFFPLVRALQGIQENRLTGVLRIYEKEKPISLCVQRGHPIMATTRDIDDYLQGVRLDFPSAQKPALDKALRQQAETGCPFLLLLEAARLLTHEQSSALVLQFGLKLFSRTWTCGAVRFEFESLEQLPKFMQKIRAPEISMDEWSLESLRQVDESHITGIAWADLTGTPVFTSEGFARIQKLILTDEERQFAVLVGHGGLSLEEISSSIGISPSSALAILFRFMSLEIVDYWSSAALGGA